MINCRSAALFGRTGMAARGIVYVPDYVNNRMGIVNCANEQYGRIGQLGSSTDPLVQARM